MAIKQSRTKGYHCFVWMLWCDCNPQPWLVIRPLVVGLHWLWPTIKPVTTQALTALAAAAALFVLRGESQPWQQALIAQAQAEAYLGLGALTAAEVAVHTAIAAEEISVLPDAYRV